MHINQIHVGDELDLTFEVPGMAGVEATETGIVEYVGDAWVSLCLYEDPEAESLADHVVIVGEHPEALFGQGLHSLARTTDPAQRPPLND